MAPRGGGLYRINDSPSWQIRETANFHLYAPQTLYHEDYTALTGRDPGNQGAFVLFRGGIELGLQPMVEVGDGFAAFSDPTDELIDLFYEMAKIGQTYGEEGFRQAQSLLWKMAEFLCACQTVDGVRYRRQTAIEPPRAQSLVETIDAYLQAHLTERVTIEEIARHLHLSPSAISHGYKKATGQSPIASLIGFRIQMAKALLLKGYSLKTIAAQTGFTDSFHLSHAFKQAHGVSPREYLKRIAQ
jgi:AraC-like DNA-binding protein